MSARVTSFWKSTKLVLGLPSGAAVAEGTARVIAPMLVQAWRTVSGRKACAVL